MHRERQGLQPVMTALPRDRRISERSNQRRIENLRTNSYLAILTLQPGMDALEYALRQEGVEKQWLLLQEI